MPIFIFDVFADTAREAVYLFIFFFVTFSWKIRPFFRRYLDRKEYIWRFPVDIIYYQDIYESAEKKTATHPRFWFVFFTLTFRVFCVFGYMSMEKWWVFPSDPYKSINLLFGSFLCRQLIIELRKGNPRENQNNILEFIISRPL